MSKSSKRKAEEAPQQVIRSQPRFIDLTPYTPVKQTAKLKAIHAKQVRYYLLIDQLSSPYNALL